MTTRDLDGEVIHCFFPARDFLGHGKVHVQEMESPTGYRGNADKSHPWVLFPEREEIKRLVIYHDINFIPRKILKKITPYLTRRSTQDTQGMNGWNGWKVWHNRKGREYTKRNISNIHIIQYNFYANNIKIFILRVGTTCRNTPPFLLPCDTW